jgi:hypothetical protein
VHRLSRVFGCFVFTVITASGATITEAAPITALQYVKLGDGPGSTGGGEFFMTEVNANGSAMAGAWAFVTFCIQRTEYIDFSSVFQIEGVTTNAVSDPPINGGVNGKDPLDPRTAYLYTRFRDGSLPNYTYNYTPAFAAQHRDSANQLQIAIWMIEQEVRLGDGTGLWNPNNLYFVLANDAIANGQWSGLGMVRVLNLRYGSLSGTEAQDQLALVTPEPTSLMLLGSGLMFAASRIRRRSRRD